MATPNTAKHFAVLAWGMVYASVCTNLTDEEATSRLNAVMPTGISSRWTIAEDETFADGASNPCPCPHVEGARHILFDC